MSVYVDTYGYICTILDSERIRQGSAAAGFNITQDFRRTYTHYYYII